MESDCVFKLGFFLINAFHKLDSLIFLCTSWVQRSRWLLRSPIYLMIYLFICLFKHPLQHPVRLVLVEVCNFTLILMRFPLRLFIFRLELRRHRRFPESSDVLRRDSVGRVSSSYLRPVYMEVALRWVWNVKKTAKKLPIKLPQMHNKSRKNRFCRTVPNIGMPYYRKLSLHEIIRIFFFNLRYVALIFENVNFRTIN